MNQAYQPIAAVSEHMLHLLHHTLGLRPDRREPCRNHFVAGPGHHDQLDLNALESAGLMRRAKTPAFLDKEDVVFVCTDAGKSYAIDHLAPEPPKPKRSNYRDFIDADYGFCFAEWLGINRPFYEARRSASGWEYQMRRRNRLYTWGEWGAVSGKWKPTQKEAKASYKEALRKFQDASKDKP